MKKWLIVLSVVLVLFICSIYIFIPGKIVVSKTEIVRSPGDGVVRSIQNFKQWSKWWPSSGGSDSGSSFVYNGIRYRPDQKLYSGVTVLIGAENAGLMSRINIFHLGFDSTAIEWVGEIPRTFNPVKRLVNYNESKIIGKNMDVILHNFGGFVMKAENIYGIPIHLISTIDTILISTKNIYPSRPTQKEIYLVIDSLKKYAAAHGSRQNGYPMLNIRPLDRGSFQVMVAIPLDKYITGTGRMESKRMVPGNFLMSEIVGGEATIDSAFHLMKQFMHDYGKKEVAIPFQVLITDRTIEKDTTKWITNLYYPVYD